jgi:uncharacterized protein (TIGR03086 family)
MTTRSGARMLSFSHAVPTAIETHGTAAHGRTLRPAESRFTLPASHSGYGPTVTRDNPGRRCEDGDRGWSRYERPLDAVDLTECAVEATLAQVGEDQWTAPTGCGDWTVRDLVDHALFWQCNLASLLGAQVTPEDGWDTIKATIVAGLGNPSALDGAIEAGPMTGMPKHQGMGLATADVLVHGWDLARAIGADDTMPAAAVEAVHMGLSQAPAELIRNPQLFGPIVEVPADASAQDKLIGFVGRQP